ncbi:MAG: hypothetical protein RPU64_10970 [Candidatus Sedimenticola sp. (ex Thyasira tokunagai)]
MIEYHSRLTALGYHPLHIDLYNRGSGLTTEAISSMLLMLELEGRVSSAPGGRYRPTTTRGAKQAVTHCFLYILGF